MALCTYCYLYTPDAAYHEGPEACVDAANNASFYQLKHSQRDLRKALAEAMQTIERLKSSDVQRELVETKVRLANANSDAAMHERMYRELADTTHQQAALGRKSRLKAMSARYQQ